MALIIRYLPFDDRNDETAIVAELARKGIHLGPNNYLVYNRFNPGAFADELRTRLLQNSYRGHSARCFCNV